MASTIQGYEGTGRSLSIKLISKIKEEQTRSFKEINLEQAIRYADNDPVENWLNKLLCLDCVKDDTLFLSDYPHIEECELYLVNKDTLFSYKKTSEAFLNSLMALFVSSHYKNSPNDIQLISDSSSHKIFILTKNIKKQTLSGLPEIYCVIQVAEEGGITKDIIDRSKETDNLPPGDLIPWTLSNYFLDSDFPKIKGVRVVRIATHPSAQRMGYGKKALDLLFNYYQGKCFNISKMDDSINNTSSEVEKQSTKGPLLNDLSEIEQPKDFSYVGTSFGLTNSLFKFWKNSGFTPVYMRTLQNTITGEYSCIMVKQIQNENIKLNENSTSNSTGNWLDSFYNDFTKRIHTLLSYEFKNLRVDLASDLINKEVLENQDNANNYYNLSQLQLFFNKEDFKRLQKYSQGLLNVNLILDLVPNISLMYFGKKINKSISPEQSMILIGIGLQRKTFEEVEKELNTIKREKTSKHQIKNISNFGIDIVTVMGMFKKIIIKFTDYLKKQYEEVYNKSDENVFNKNGNTDLALNNVDESMKINPREDLFGKDNNVKKQDKKIKTEYYSEKFTGQKRNKTQ